ncbi:MAG TPA: tetratricopeptide repeat protein, partial [Bacillaceae bacterium]
AREHLETAIKLNPDFHEAHYNLALLYYNEGNRQQAVEHAERAYSLSGDKKYKEFLDKHGR